jgi:hypothetical protein
VGLGASAEHIWPNVPRGFGGVSKTGRDISTTFASLYPEIRLLRKGFCIAKVEVDLLYDKWMDNGNATLTLRDLVYCGSRVCPFGKELTHTEVFVGPVV